MALEAIVSRKDVYKVILEEYPGLGVYILVYPESNSDKTSRDSLQTDWVMAKRACLRLYEITEVMWHEIPDINFLGPKDDI